MSGDELGEGGLSGTPDMALWYAIQVKTNWERQAGQLLENKGYEIFVPVQKVKRQWSDRVKELETPLFPSYIFGRFSANNRMPILTTPSVYGIVSAGKRLLPICEDQVEDVKRLVQSGLPILPSEFLQVGQRVKILGGALEGQKGILSRIKNSWRVVISVDLIRQSVAVEVDRDQVELVGG